MKIKQTLLLVVAMLFTSVGHAAISERCSHVLAQSALTFSAVDLLNRGYSAENLPTQAVHIEAFNAETVAMLDVYDAGASFLQKGHGRSDAVKFIRSVNAKHTEVDTGVKQILDEAAENVFMCGYDDQLSDS